MTSPAIPAPTTTTSAFVRAMRGLVSRRGWGYDTGVRRGIIATALALIVLVPAANADHDDANLPWPAALPPQQVSTAVQPRPISNCPRPARISCMDRLLRRLQAQWRSLDATCDHRALFSLAYVRITKGIRDDLARAKPRYFRYRKWMLYVITTFSNRYFRQFRNWERRAPVAPAWQIAFDEAARGDVNGGQDVLLASNAHTQNDLPYVYAEQGMRDRDGTSRKADHDAVNEINTRVFDQLEDEFAQRYDSQFTWIDLKPSPLDELGTMEMVKGWREGAWRNAERLMNARTPAERQRVSDDITQTSRLWAEAIRSGEMPGYRAQRDEYCRSQKT